MVQRIVVLPKNGICPSISEKKFAGEARGGSVRTGRPVVVRAREIEGIARAGVERRRRKGYPDSIRTRYQNPYIVTDIISEPA
jgi:hypothetical protein